MSFFRPSRSRGLTLIELLVALSIFSILGVLCYRALEIASTSQLRITEDLHRWHTIARAMQRLQTNLQQAVSAPPSAGKKQASLSFNPSGLPELQFLRPDKGRGVSRQALRLTAGELVMIRWDNQNASGNESREVLMSGVREVRWHFLKDGRQSQAWPPVTGQTDELPDAVGVELDLVDVGKLSRTFLLRW
jgi:general secretion pathway protein J